MKNLALALLLAATAITGANAQSGVVIEPGVGTLDVVEPMRNFTFNEDAQDIQRYVASYERAGGVPIVAETGGYYAWGAPCDTCNTCTNCCPSDCTRCIPRCCPDTRGIFDGGLRQCNPCRIVACKESAWAGTGFRNCACA